MGHEVGKLAREAPRVFRVSGRVDSMTGKLRIINQAGKGRGLHDG
ncbi:MAG: hypothetical protein ACE5I5_12590 [Candidatus Heimdallarchaeota archaeon]